MKTLNETFTDKEWMRLQKAKKKYKPIVTWHDFIMLLARGTTTNGRND